jgi:hypothetical protein
MPENPVSKSVGSDEAEQEFFETLRQTAFIFQNDKNGRFLGPILACRAVARFIYLKNRGAELAGPFLQIAEAFKVLERGGKPRLFTKKSTPLKERERSPERKHIHRLAAASLEVLVRITTPGSRAWDEDTKKRISAANLIARHVNKWPGMAAQDVTGRTVIAWRDQQRGLSESERKQFDLVVEKILADRDPQTAVDELLRSGPPGFFKD